MPRPALRSRSKRRVFKKTPSGTKLEYKSRKPQQAHCASCKKKLAGVPRGNRTTIAKVPKTQRRPERPFGGVLCSACSRVAIKKKLRTS